ncbi:MAG: hypothetical protein P1U56_25320 [Saprospiraceae bacterium]|nr:hypothetical protein [Saprospiraceae bacterium]
MDKLKITITPVSYLASSGNAGGPMIDIDVLYDTETGIPYLNGKRIKGLLRESAREVLEIYNLPEKEVDKWINRVFGNGDRHYGSCSLYTVPNFYIDGYENIKRSIISYKKEKNLAFSSGNVLAHFTSEKMVTALNDQGVAKDKSLRSYRLINPSTPELPITFSAIFEAKLSEGTELTSNSIPIAENKRLDEIILEKACHNLRYMGTSRNRGLGKIKVEMENLGGTIKEKASSFNVEKALAIDLVTEGPIIIPTKHGDQNTINTDEVINGSMVRGLLASKYLSLVNPPLSPKEAHKDHDFFDIFLSGNVQFCELKPNGQSTLSFNIQKYKAHPSKSFVDVFSKEENDHHISKKYNKRGTIQNDTFIEENISKHIQFHNSRFERKAGRSTENHPGIYYYESISPGHHFSGKITGSQELLQKLIDTLGSSFDGKIGKSKSVEYGKVKVKLSQDQKNQNGTKKVSDTYAIKVLTPVILENEHFLPKPSFSALIKALGIQLSNTGKIHAASKTTTVEHYNSVWQSKTQMYPAFDEGSIFLIDCENQPAVDHSIGLLTHLGYGKIAIEAYSPIQISEIKENENQDNSETIATPSDILGAILNAYNYQELDNKIHLAALETVERDRNIRKLSNSQLSRLKAVLNTHQTIQKYQSEFDHFNKETKKNEGMKHREIGSTMIRWFIYNDIYKLNMPDNVIIEIKTFDPNYVHFVYGKKYWNYVFEAALKSKKEIL